MLRAGLDIGSTTIKAVVISEVGQILYSDYQRHYSRIHEKACSILKEIHQRFSAPMALAISGSAGMGLAEDLKVPFIQEVYAERHAIMQMLPDTDAVIELGGEDAKIIFLKGGMDVCMNGSCAGGTGSFIDQMAVLLQCTQEELNELAASSRKIYPIASRCGVFAKSDIQPLINQGARKEDIAASIFDAVVSQTIAGLAHGRTIKGNVVYLGGPLTFFNELKNAFDRTLKLKGIVPENSLYYVALGSALLCSKEEIKLDQLTVKLENHHKPQMNNALKPLFENKEEREDFFARHHQNTLPDNPVEPCYDKLELYIGMDAGSTTVKCAAVDETGRIRLYQYEPSGKPVESVRNFLLQVYELFPNALIRGTSTTGYGEDLIKAAFHADEGIVETVAHFTAAKKYDPAVDFILDIGGQDIKCFKVKNDSIDQIFLNEACSSGCGSFLQTFSAALGCTPSEFAQKALESRSPVDLGSRCTVFMNSSVKQAQKDGASLEDIAAGLSISVVKNALYKVIRLKENEKPGNRIIVQGGTFLNDAVLRAFEKEINTNVIRPCEAGLMGCYGAALHIMQHDPKKSSLLSKEELEQFEHVQSSVTCKGCTNHCSLSLNRFKDGTCWIAGNQCSRPLKNQPENQAENMYEIKRTMLASYTSVPGSQGMPVIGLPLVLNNFELLPFWHTLFQDLGFGILVSSLSSKKTYQNGQHLIPSDTACYPAKIVHGHLLELEANHADAIFYPNLTYALDEGLADNHYNCPVVAYYPEVCASTWKSKTPILSPYLGLHRRRELPEKLRSFLNEKLSLKITRKQMKKAVLKAYQVLENYMSSIRSTGEKLYSDSIQAGVPVVILAGRPYHIDPEINHGIDRYIASSGMTVLTEDSILNLCHKADTDVLNQWTYHARLYCAAQFAAQRHADFVQLVGFGCGIDAITTDEIRAILEEKGQLYTQLKIDETNSLGAAKIRLRSLFAYRKDCEHVKES